MSSEEIPVKRTKIDDERTRSEHPAFGVIAIHRVTSTPGIHLFDSAFQHGQYISLKISRASVDRHLNNHWIHNEAQLIEVNLSEAQFATMITSLNLGVGSPCTIDWFNGEDQGRCPPDDTKETFSMEVSESTTEIGDQASQVEAELDNLLEKQRMTKADKEGIRRKMAKLTQNIKHNLPFIQDQFAESMERTTEQAKAEVAAHMLRVKGALIGGASDQEVDQLLGFADDSPALPESASETE